MTDENAFRFTLLGITVIQSAVGFYWMARAKAAATVFRQREEGVLLSVLLGTFYLGYCWGIVAYLIEPRWMAWGALAELPSWARWIGLGPLLLGVILVLWGLRSLGTSFAFSVSPQEGSRLVTTGLYRWVRHPLYTAFLIEAAGITLLISNWFVGLMAAVLWGLLVYRTHMEEEKLLERFGDDYRKYADATGRFFPRFIK